MTLTKDSKKGRRHLTHDKSGKKGEGYYVTRQNKKNQTTKSTSPKHNHAPLKCNNLIYI